MNSVEGLVVLANSLSAFVGLLLMQTKYRGYTLVERLSLAFLIGALAMNATMHVLDGRAAGACAEALLSIAILCRFLTAALWRFLKCGKCPVTILLLLAGLLLAGCSTVDREYQAGYDFSTGRTTAGVRLTPGHGQRSFSANVSGELDWNWANKDLAKLYRDK